MYNKLFTKILDSSVWLEPSDTRIVWVTLMAAMDEDGFCQFASLTNLARRAIVPLEACRLAVERLEAPDPESSDPENEGRRIERVPGGWIVLNGAKHKLIVTREESKRMNRERASRYRARKAGDPDEREQNPEGYVYYALNYEICKIGFSRNPWARLKELQCANPSIRLIGTEKGSYVLEKQRHKQFESSHREREWFHYTKELKDFVATLTTTTEPTTEGQSNAVVVQSETETYTETEAKASTRARKEARESAQRISQAVNPEASEDLSEWAERIAVAHPRSQLKHLGPMEVPQKDLQAVVAAILLEAAKAPSSPAEAAKMLLGCVEALAEAVPREQWHFLKPVTAYFAEFEYRRDPETFKRSTRAQGGAGNGKSSVSDENAAALRRLFSDQPEDGARAVDPLPRRDTGEGSADGPGDLRLRGGTGPADTGGDGAGILAGAGGVPVLPAARYPARVQWPRR